MKTAIVYNKNDHKLKVSAYSWSYRSMFLALVDYFMAFPVTENCHAKDIDADVIIFFDPHSSHHIKIENIADHPATKIEFFNDPHQKQMPPGFIYADGTPCEKLGARQRVRRALARGVEYIICPYKAGYYKHIAPYLGGRADDMLLHFPIAPDVDLFSNGNTKIKFRQQQVLANGCTWSARLDCYDFRNWAFKQENVENIIC